MTRLKCLLWAAPIWALACAPPKDLEAPEPEDVEEDLAEILALETTVDAPADPGDPLPLGEPTLCVPQADGRIWTSVYREADGSPCDRGLDCDNVEYACIEVADGPIEYTRPEEPGADTDCEGNPLHRVAFVVDGTGGEFRYAATNCTGGPPVATLLAFSGGGGTDWRDSFYSASEPFRGRDPDGDNDPNDNDYRALERAGIRVVAVRWQTGVKRSIWDLGWITRTSPGARPYPDMLRKPATLIKYVGSHIEPGTGFGVAGTSAGSLQASTALIHDVGVHIDYLGLHAGGGLGVALPYSCGALTTNILVSPFNGDLCQRGNVCVLHGDAPMPGGVKEVWDYALAPARCTGGTAEELAPLSFVSMEWHGATPDRVGFLVNNDWASDNILGATWAAGIMRLLVFLRTGVWGEWGNGTGMHGHAMASGDPSFALFKDQVMRGLLE